MNDQKDQPNREERRIRACLRNLKHEESTPKPKQDEQEQQP